ncbi:MAG: 3-isopropylmalate dehydratase small subunit [Alphaproteobacteria bacterium]|nr:3-isopropylmalate dehydratase small subunit [Alphaproteobacteria bacterium]
MSRLLPGPRTEPLAAVDGAAMVFGDDVNTDLLHPSYFFSLDADTVRQGFLGQVAGKATDGTRSRVLLAGDNFGCGSSRETTMQSLRLAGVQALVATSFGRIFFRNALCLGLPAFSCPDAATLAEEGQPVRVDPLAGTATNLATGRTVALTPLDPFWRQVLEAGGMMPWLEQRGSLT